MTLKSRRSGPDLLQLLRAGTAENRPKAARLPSGEELDPPRPTPDPIPVAERKTTPGKKKGKILLDLSEAAVTATRLTGALDRLVDALAQIDRQWSDIAPWPTPKAVG